MTDGPLRPLRPHRPRKRFGQHFLTDRGVLNRLVRLAVAFDPGNDGRILEIGPGRGALTDLLVDSLAGAQMKNAAPITVVELDRDLAQRLERRYAPERVRVIQADMLVFNLRDAIASDDPRAPARLRLVGNLPYNISTPLIFHLLKQIEHVHDMLFMLQKEVALRLAAGPGNKNYGRLSVMAAVELDCEPLFDVPPDAFDPPPKVTSTVLRLTPKKQPLQARDRQVFNTVVATAFGQRRKTLHNSLATLVQNEQFAQANINPALRAEALSVEEYVALADVVSRVQRGGLKSD